MGGRPLQPALPRPTAAPPAVAPRWPVLLLAAAALVLPGLIVALAAVGQYAALFAVGSSALAAGAVYGGHALARRGRDDPDGRREARRLRAALDVSEARRRAILESALDCIICLDDQGLIVEFNPAAEQTFGQRRADVLGRALTEVCLPREFEQALAQQRSAEGFHLGERFEVRVARAGGAEFLAELALTAVQIMGRRGSVAYLRDITQRKQAEASLQAAESKLRRITDALPGAVYQYRLHPDVGQSFAFISRGARELFGHAPEQLLQDFNLAWDQVLPEDLAGLRASIQESARTRRPWGFEFRIRRPDGGVRWIRGDSTPEPPEPDGSTLWNGTLTDVTARKQAEEQLQQARDAAVAANRAKNQFLANVSHEVRTPLSGILGMTALALETPLTAEQRECLETVKSSADALLGIINDLLDFSKMEAGKIDLESGDFRLRDVLGDTLKGVAVVAHRKGLELASAVAPEAPETLVGDAKRLRQVLLNLVGNAIKFTAHGEVVVAVTADRQSADDVLLHFAVRDTGIGIPPEKHRVIFEPFVQADGTTTRRFGGTGLGLTIAQKLVEMMGGRVWLDSAAGRGSVFHFTARFDLQRTSRAKFVLPRPPSWHGQSVLVVDDNATQAKSLEEQLRHWRLNPVVVGGAAAALEKVRAAAAPFDLLVVDADMPGTDGFGLVEQLRAEGRLGPTLMLLSSLDYPRATARCQRLGVAASLAKPLRHADLWAALQRLIDRDAPALVTPAAVGAGAAPREVRPGRPLRVLLAEDNPVNQKLALAHLDKLGHRATLAGDGRTALEVLQRESFDLVLMDVQMPELDGLETTAELRRRERGTGRRLPVIAMTAFAMAGDRQRCLDVGMDEYLSKPIQFHELSEAIDAVLAQAPPAPGPPPPPAPAPAAGLIDMEVALRCVNGDQALLREVSRILLAECPRMLKQLHEAVQAGDAVRVQRAAHSVKGAVCSFGATRVVEAAWQLEAAGRGQDLSQAPALHGRLRDLLEQFRDELAALAGPG